MKPKEKPTKEKLYRKSKSVKKLTPIKKEKKKLWWDEDENDLYPEP